MAAAGQLRRVLLVEDNPGDVVLFREALADASVTVDLATVPDGQAALDYLYRRPPFEDATRPAVVFLDLNLPRRSGRDVLSRLKSDADLRSIPVVVYTGSDAEDDVRRAYELHANCYIQKPPTVGALAGVIRSVEAFWFGVVTLPP